MNRLMVRFGKQCTSCTSQQAHARAHHSTKRTRLARTQHTEESATDHSRGRNIALRRAGARPSASRQPPSRVVAAKLETAGYGSRAVEAVAKPRPRETTQVLKD